MTRTRRIATIAVMGMIGALAGTTIAAAGGGGHCAPTEGSAAQVALEGACFTPSTLRADVGETITFVNRDAFPHNVSGTGWGHYEDMGQGDRFTTSFEVDGIYPFACTLHPGMNGVVVVGEETGVQALADAGPPTASSGSDSDGGAWLAGGAVGLVVGAAAGVGLAGIRRRDAASPTAV